MTTLNSEVYEAFRSLGVDEEKSMKAASALAAHGEITDVRSDVADLKHDVADLKRDMLLLKWMVGSVGALTIAIFVKLMVH